MVDHVRRSCRFIYTPQNQALCHVPPWAGDTASSVWEHGKYTFWPGSLSKPCSFCQGFPGDAVCLPACLPQHLLEHSVTPKSCQCLFQRDCSVICKECICWKETQQRESWGLCSIRTATPGQSPPKPRCQDSWLLREADKSEVSNEMWWCVHVLLRRGVNFGLLSHGRDPHVRQVHWQLRLLSLQPVSPRGRVFFWWLHEPCFASGSAYPLEVFCCDSFLEEWSGCAVQKSLNLLVSQHAVLYFSRNFFTSVSALQLSISCLALISPLPSSLRGGAWTLKFASQRQNHCWPWQAVCRLKTFLRFSLGPAPA